MPIKCEVEETETDAFVAFDEVPNADSLNHIVWRW